MESPLLLAGSTLQIVLPLAIKKVLKRERERERGGYDMENLLH